MSSLSRLDLRIADRLKDESFRRKYFRSLSKKEVAVQIRCLREHRQLTQVKFAKLCRMGQSAVSRIEQADYSGWTYKTLAKVAEKLDAKLSITLEPSEDVIRRYWVEEHARNTGSGAIATAQNYALKHIVASQSLGMQEDWQQLLMKHRQPGPAEALSLPCPETTLGQS